MIVTLIGKNSMNKITLPQNAVGNYWLSDRTEDKEKKLINIEGRAGNWMVTSNNYAKIIDLRQLKITSNGIKINKTPKLVNEIILKEYTLYGILLGNSEELFILYCSPTFENNFSHLDIKNTTEICIGKDSDNHISYANEFVADVHSRMFFNNGRWMIENNDTKFGTFVNSKAVNSNGKILSNGDVISIMGLKIIIMGKSIYINKPKDDVIYSDEFFKINDKKLDIIADDEEEEEEIELYSEKEYFSRAPRITNIIEREKVRIDAPPQSQDKEDMPLILSLGTSLTMGVMMIMTIMNTLDASANGTATLKRTILSLISSGAMLIGMLVFPIITQKYNRRKKKKYEEKRQKRYKEYLNSKSEAINKIMNKQRNILFENYTSPEECAKIILEKGPRLWERKIEDYDFLSVRLGIGDVPLEIDIQYPEEKFSMEDDNLVEILNSIANNSKVLKSAPVAISLAEKNVSALIVHDERKIKKFMQSLIIQLIAFQSYEDLKLVFLLKEDKAKNWEYVKMLPHIWNNTKQIRFFADEYEDMKEISKYLEEDLKNIQQYKDVNYKSFMPYYLIITDDYKKIENLKIITEILKSKVKLGFSILCIGNDLIQLPNECKTFVDLDKKVGMLFENEISSTNQKQIIFDTSVTFFFEKICEAISNIPIRYTAAGSNILPNSYTFLEMYDVGRIEQLNILERWKKHNATLSLKAPIGIDGAGLPVVLDIHEKFHGPHGLIAGTTGSGKSEFIITYVLSLAINYHPDDVTFILIDYKGGGLAGAFQKREVKLPHLVGTITNIDTVGLQRSLASIQSEVRRRQVVFNEARNITDEGTIDIYKYQKLYHEGKVKQPVPHLLIICDEFAELKQQQPDFMEELMSVSRIGRSLGVHLILATQKPSGIVNDQIRSNSKFAVCLKVQDKADSNDVISKPDAASLKKAGQFYMKVGNDEYFVLGQSGWAGASYVPSDVTEKKIDNSIEFISNIGTTIKQLDDTVQKVVNSDGEQLTNIVKYIYEISKKEGIQAKSLWLDSIPETIFIEETKEKYNVKVLNNDINPVVGEYDDPSNQRQGIVDVKLSEEGNAVIYGNAESGKETLLSTMVYDLIKTHTSEEVNLYLLDFGTEALKIYKDAPQVGDVVFINDTEKISRFFDMLQNEIKERKQVLSDYNGDYKLYLNTSGKSMPMIVVTINNYEAFAEIYENEYDDTLLTLTREGAKCGIVFVFSVGTYNSMKYRLAQNFKQKIALQLNKDDEYLSIFDKVGKKRPSHMFGRGLICMEDQIYEFQTAKICEAEDYNLHIKDEIEKLKAQNMKKARNIPVMPDKVTFESVRDSLRDISKVPIGIAKKDLNVFLYNFRKNFVNIISSRNIEEAAQFAINIVEELKNLENANIYVFDAERIYSTQKIDLGEEYMEFVSKVENEKNKDNLCIIIGIDKFLNDFESPERKFTPILKSLEETGRCNFVLVENVNKFKSHEYDDWYKAYISKDTGIWVGSGVDNQYLITINSERRSLINNCGCSFGYVI